MRNVLAGLLTLAVAGLLTGCATANAAPNMTGGSSHPPTGHSLKVTLDAQNGSGEKGTALLHSLTGGKTHVEITVTGEPSGAKQPAHIHPGSCSKLNPVPKWALSDVVGGRSATDVPIAMDKLTTGGFSINAHAGGGPLLSKYVFCGTIQSK